MFGSEEACVSYAAQNTLVTIPASVSVSFTPSTEPGSCDATVNLSHYTPNTSHSVLVLWTWDPVFVQDVHGIGPVTVTTDSSGSGSLFVSSIPQQFDPLHTYNLLDVDVDNLHAFIGGVSCP